jgi:integrase
MAIDWRPDGNGGAYRVRVSYKDGTGKRRHDSATIRVSDHGGKRAALNAAKKREIELTDARRDQADDPATLATLTVADLGRRWLQATADRRGQKAQTVTAHYLADYIVPPIGAVKLAQIGPVHIGQVRERTRTGVGGHELADTTRRHVHMTMVAMFGWGVRHGLLAQAPTDRVDPPRVEFTPRQVISADLFGDVVAAVDRLAPPHVAAAFRLSLATGVRQGEVAGLQWGDWDAKRSVLTVARSILESRKVREGGKSGRIRHVILGDATAAWLTGWRATLDDLADELGLPPLGAGDPIVTWVTHRGTVAWRGHLRPGLLGDWWRANRAQVADEVGDPAIAEVKWHGLRHSAVTALIEAGVSPTDVGAVIGHSAVATTLGYWRDGGAAARRVADASPLG